MSAGDLCTSCRIRTARILCCPIEYLAEKLRKVHVGGIELYSPDPDSVLKPTEGKLKWIIVAACFVINVCNTLIMDMTIYGVEYISAAADWESMKKWSNILQVYRIVMTMSGPVAALVMIWVGYRTTAIAGGIMEGLGLFIASLLNEESVDGIGFFVAGVAGTGHGFLVSSSVVPILEYFTKKRMLALVLSYLGQVLGAIIVVILVETGTLNRPWDAVFRFQLIPVCIALVCGALLKPLSLDLRENGVGCRAVMKRILGISSWKSIQGAFLCVVFTMVFLHKYAKSLTFDDVKAVAADEEKSIGNTEQSIVAISPSIGELVALVSLFIIKKKRVRMVLFAIAIMNTLVGPMTGSAPAMEPFGLILIYGLIYGFTIGAFHNLLDFSIEKMFGRLHIRFVVGVFGIAKGIGEIASIYSKESLESLENKVNDKYKATFYLSGALLMASAVFAFISLLMFREVEDEGTPDTANTTEGV